MAGITMKFIGQVIVTIASVIISIFLTKLYRARTLVRQLQKEGFVRGKTAKIILNTTS